MAKVAVRCKPCIVCNEEATLLLDEDSVKRYEEGAYVQDAFPYLSADQRELILTGTHPKCWDQMFAGEE